MPPPYIAPTSLVPSALIAKACQSPYSLGNGAVHDSCVACADAKKLLPNTAGIRENKGANKTAIKNLI
jgi:hypothetical protein